MTMTKHLSLAILSLVWICSACGGGDGGRHHDRDDACADATGETDLGPALCVSDLECDDRNPCTLDLCSTQLGCLSSPLGGACDDGNPCTRSDGCQNGTCAGTPITGCGAPVCGDGSCAQDESCASCPLDCSPIGAGQCGAACDPLAATPGCPDNFACLPTAGGLAALDILENGNGVCGAGCTDDTDCEGGVCLPFDGLTSKGLCTALCEPDSVDGCGPLARCLTAADAPGAGYCFPGQACSPGEASCDCIPTVRLEAGGVCLESCFAAVSAGCPFDYQSCIGRTGPGFHEGLCVGQDAPCDPALQTGCEEAQTCAPVAGPAIKGTALVCMPATGAGAEGTACVGNAGSCGPGLLCDGARCRKPCDPGAPACEEGSCREVGAVWGLTQGELGLCLPLCGDGDCSEDETCDSCAADCGECPACGDEACTAGETCDTCAADCGDCPWCGDGGCNGDETCADCPEDCAACPTCGDETCNGQETCATCEDDCGKCSTDCGDKICSPAEFCFSCPEDCGSCSAACGDKNCAADETCWSCPADCGACPWKCGDGECNPGEGCSNCAADCPLLGIGACSGSCDPLLAEPGCNANQVCAPTRDGTLFLDAFSFGNGVCGEGCSKDADCGTGTCLGLEGLAAAGICAPACVPGQEGGCAAGEACVALPAAPAKGACVAGQLCGFGADCGSALTACIRLSGSDADGVCLPGCLAPENACGALTCISRTGEEWHSGSCLGQQAPCDAVAQTGCEAEETCRILAGPGLIGLARVCDPHTGAAGFGQDCEPGAAPCKPGLVCIEGTCGRYCAVGGAACTEGVCFDFSAVFAQPAGSVGVCL